MCPKYFSVKSERKKIHIHPAIDETNHMSVRQEFYRHGAITKKALDLLSILLKCVGENVFSKAFTAGI